MSTLNVIRSGLFGLLGSLMLLTSTLAQDASKVNIPVPPYQRCDSFKYQMTKEDIEKDFVVDLPEQVTYENGVMYWEANEQKYWPGLTYRENDIWYGKASITLKMAPKSGIATAFIRGKQSADEVDFEWVGKDTKNVQSTFFVDGHHKERKEAKFSAGSSDLAAEFHTYDLVYKKDMIEWWMDGKQIDSWSKNEHPTAFPANAREWKMNLWNGGLQHGDWAGKIDWTSEPKSAKAAISAISFESYCDADAVKGEHKTFGAVAAAPLTPAPVQAALPAPVPSPTLATQPEVQPAVVQPVAA
ncbi:putative glycosidase CRH2 [Dimargaris cristalligena]|nr:putative glycosidase CRH2 [Dimargaris cristalligena]